MTRWSYESSVLKFNGVEIPMTIIDKRQPKPRPRRQPEAPPPAPHQIHRAVFTDGNPPAVVAVDAQPWAGDVVYGCGTPIATVTTDPAGLATSVRHNSRKIPR